MHQFLLAVTDRKMTEALAISKEILVHEPENKMILEYRKYITDYIEQGKLHIIQIFYYYLPRTSMLGLEEEEEEEESEEEADEEDEKSEHSDISSDVEHQDVRKNR